MLVNYNNVPSWAMQGACMDLWFERNKYHGVHVTRRSSNRTGCLSPSVFGADDIIGAPNSSGVVELIKQFSPRITTGMGLWAEQVRNNALLWSRDLTNVAWTKTNMTAAKNQVGADNSPNGASSLTATAANATATQSVTRTIRDIDFSAYIRRITGTGAINLSIDNGATFTNIASSLNSTTFTKVDIPFQNLANPIVVIRIDTSGDAIAIDFTQLEDGQFSTTPIVTTTAAVSVTADETQFGSNGNPNAGNPYIDRFLINREVTLYSEFSRYNTSTGTFLFSGSVTSTIFQIGSASGFVSISNSASTIATTANTVNAGINVVNKAACTVRGNRVAVCLNGGTVVSQTGRPVTGVSYDHMGIGNNGAGAIPMHGVTRRLVIIPKRMTDEWLQTVTR